MRFGIIGAGSRGSALGERLIALGHEVVFGGPGSARESAARLGVSAGSNAEVSIAYADIPRDVGLRLLERGQAPPAQR